jgi:hypothetical protein
MRTEASNFRHLGWEAVKLGFAVIAGAREAWVKLTTFASVIDIVEEERKQNLPNSLCAAINSGVEV